VTHLSGRLHPRPRPCQLHGIYQRGCPTCRLYCRGLRRLRRRLRAYGLWVGRVDADPARKRIRQLVAAGMSVNRIAAVSGVSRYTLAAIHNGQPLAHEYIVSAIVGCPLRPTGWRMVDATGTVRRLQALCAAGYSSTDVAQLLDRRPITVAHWRCSKPGSLIRANTHALIARLYNELWDTAGPSPAAARYALKVADPPYQPYEAWTDRTIDDPAATPFSDPEAIEFIDQVRLQEARDGRRPFLNLSEAEQRHLYTQHVSTGRSIRSFRDRYRPVPAELLRRLQQEVVA